MPRGLCLLSVLLVACGSPRVMEDEPMVRDAGFTVGPRDGGVVVVESRDAGTVAARDGGTVARRDAGSIPSDPRFDAFASAFEAERQRNGVTGAAVAIIEGGQITFARGFGAKHPARSEAVEPTTLFRIGSVNKVLTAAVLLGLLAEHNVAIDAPVVSVVPEFAFTRDPTWAPSIRIEHLLTHQSGIVDYSVTFADAAQREDSALDEFLTGEFGRIGYLMAPAGRFYNYSNPNFSLAGLLIERLSENGYRAEMKRRLFDPLAMRRTYFLGAEAIADGDYASGVGVDDNGARLVVEPDTYDNAWARPAGFAYSTVLDLAQFVLFLRNGDPSVLDAARHAALQAPQVDTDELGDLSHYGYGLSIFEGLFLSSGFRNARVIQHDGAIPGFSASVWYVPDADFGFVLLASGDDAYFFDSLVMALEEIAVMPAPSAPPAIGHDPARNVDYVGRYSDPFEVGSLIVSSIDGRLEVSMPDLDAANIPYRRVLEPYVIDNFILYVDDFPLLVTFIPDPQTGRAQYIRNRLFVGARTNMARVAPKRLDAERLRGRVSRAALPSVLRAIGPKTDED